MNDEIEKSEQPNPNDVLAAITSFNDPNIIMNMFEELGWSYSLEIKETLALAKQNDNLSIKFKAIKYLRELLREAAETAGYVANVSQTIPNAQGGTTTFSGKQMAGMLNPVKQIKSIIKEPQNDTGQQETTEKLNRASNRQESQTENGSRENSPSPGRGSETDSIQDTSEQFPLERGSGRADASGDVVSGGLESRDGGSASERQRSGPAESSTSTENNPCIQTRPDDGGLPPDNNHIPGNKDSDVGSENPRPVLEGGRQDINSGGDAISESEKDENPCIQTRPPTCDQKLFPGISISTDGEN